MVVPPLAKIGYLFTVFANLNRSVRKPETCLSPKIRFDRLDYYRFYITDMFGSNCRTRDQQCARPPPRQRLKPEPKFGRLCPETGDLILPGGRRWRRQREYDERAIADTILAQSEIIQGKALGYILNTSSYCHISRSTSAMSTRNWMPIRFGCDRSMSCYNTNWC